MITAVLPWVAFLGGLIVLALSLGARDRRWKPRLRLAAAVTGVWSGVLLVAELLPNGDSTLIPSPGTAGEFPALLVAGFLLAAAAALVVEFRWDPARQFRAGIHSPIGRLWLGLTRALTDAPALDAMLLEAASAIRKATGARLGHVYRITRTNLPTCVGSTGGAGSGVCRIRDLDRLDAADEVAAALSRRGQFDTEVRYNHDGARLVGIPVGVNGRISAVIVLEDLEIDTLDGVITSYLCGMGDLVGRAAHDWALAVQGATYGRLCRRLSYLLPVLLEEKQLERGLPAVAEVLSEVVPADYLSIAWQNGSLRHENRASMAIGDGRIVEKRRRWPIADTTVRVRRLKRALITPDLNMAVPEETSRGETWESRLGMRSRMVAPILSAQEVIGTLTIAHALPARYGEEESRLVAIVCDLLALWLGGLASRQSQDSWGDAESLAVRLRTDPWRWTDMQTVLQDAQACLDVSGLRLYRLIPEKGELLETASAGRVTNGSAIRKLSLAHLPWHRFALDRSQPLHVNQDDPEMMMDGNEAALALIPDLRTANIVPVQKDNRILGFLDVMEVRDPDRKSLQSSDHFLLRTVADHAARLWSSALRNAAPAREENGAGRMAGKLKELHRDIVNPITSIIGSVELIRHKQPDPTGDTIKYLNTIERSAVRIQEATAGFYSGITPDGRCEVGPSSSAVLFADSPVVGTARTGTFTRPASMNIVRRDEINREARVTTGD